MGVPNIIRDEGAAFQISQYHVILILLFFFFLVLFYTNLQKVYQIILRSCLDEVFETDIQHLSLCLFWISFLSNAHLATIRLLARSCCNIISHHICIRSTLQGLKQTSVGFTHTKLLKCGNSPNLLRLQGGNLNFRKNLLTTVSWRLFYFSYTEY